MRTAEIELFSIDELGANQEKAIDKLRELDYYGCDESILQSEFEQTLEEYGFPTDEIEWSLGHCQGDGVAFYGDIDILKLIEKRDVDEVYGALVRLFGLSAVIKRNSHGNHYSHYNTMDVYMEREREYWYQGHRVLGKDLWEIVKNTVVEVSHMLEKRGYDIIEAHQTKEHIIECAMANEMEFRADGRLWHN